MIVWSFVVQQSRRGCCLAKNLVGNKTSRILNCVAVPVCGLLDSVFNNFDDKIGRHLFLANSSKIINPPEYLKRPSSRAQSAVGVAAKHYLDRPTTKAMATDDQLIWVDCEMSGLNIDKDTIMEIACIITGPNLEVIDRLPSIIVKTDDPILDSMDSWCIQHHGDSGLTQACRESKITLKDAEDMLLKFVNAHTRPGACPLAGNSIHVDRIFLSKYMPKFHSHLHYRNLDVSSIKEVVRRWFPQEYQQVRDHKRFEHRTMADIEDSIAELRYYRQAVFKTPSQVEGQVDKL